MLIERPTAVLLAIVLVVIVYFWNSLLLTYTYTLDRMSEAKGREMTR
jgi:hypothetical protein